MLRKDNYFLIADIYAFSCNLKFSRNYFKLANLFLYRHVDEHLIDTNPVPRIFSMTVNTD